MPKQTDDLTVKIYIRTLLTYLYDYWTYYLNQEFDSRTTPVSEGGEAILTYIITYLYKVPFLMPKTACSERFYAYIAGSLLKKINFNQHYIN